jgi:hypothetical protein
LAAPVECKRAYLGFFIAINDALARQNLFVRVVRLAAGEVSLTKAERLAGNRRNQQEQNEYLQHIKTPLLKKWVNTTCGRVIARG